MTTEKESKEYCHCSTAQCWYLNLPDPIAATQQLWRPPLHLQCSQWSSWIVRQIPQRLSLLVSPSNSCHHVKLINTHALDQPIFDLDLAL